MTSPAAPATTTTTTASQPPQPPRSSSLAERARLSMRGVRVAANKTFFSPFKRTEHQQQQPTTTPSTTEVVRLRLDGDGLRTLAALPPGALFDEKIRKRLTTNAKTTWGVTEIMFRTKSVGLTLEKSATLHEQIYVREYTSMNSPAMNTRCVAIGDLVLAISDTQANRWVRNTGQLNIITDFVQHSSRPIIIRFLRDLTPPVDYETVVNDATLSVLWLQFLQEECDGNELDDLSNAFHLAQFTLAARLALKHATKEALEGVIKTHLIPRHGRFAQRDGERVLIEWFSRHRGNTNNHADENVTDDDGTDNDDEPNDNLPAGLEALANLNRDTEDALIFGPFRRFLHSQHAKQMFMLPRPIPFDFERPLLKTISAVVTLDMILARRETANLFLIHLLSLRQHHALAAWMEIEYDVRPAWFVDWNEENLLQAILKTNSLFIRFVASGGPLKISQLDPQERALLKNTMEALATYRGSCIHCGSVSKECMNAIAGCVTSLQQDPPPSRVTNITTPDTVLVNVDDWFSNNRDAQHFFLESLNKGGGNTPPSVGTRTMARESSSHDGSISLADRLFASPLEAGTPYLMSESDGDGAPAQLESGSIQPHSEPGNNDDVGDLMDHQLSLLSFAASPEQQLPGKNIIPEENGHHVVSPPSPPLTTTTTTTTQPPKSLITTIRDCLNVLQMVCVERLQPLYESFQLSSATLFPDVVHVLSADEIIDAPRLTLCMSRAPLAAGIEVHRAPAMSTIDPSLSVPSDNITIKYALRFHGFTETGMCKLLNDSNELPTHITKFCLPRATSLLNRTVDAKVKNATFEEAEEEHKPLMFNFVLSNGGGTDKRGKLWGAVMLQWTQQDNVFVPSGMLVASEFPLFEDLRRRLLLARDSCEQNEEQQNDHHLPDETAAALALTNPIHLRDIHPDIGHLCLFDASPLLGQSTWAPSLSRLDFDFLTLFQMLSVRRVVDVFGSLLLERKVLLVSNKFSLLCLAGEAMRSLLSPLSWSHVYAPILPRSMLDTLQCPTPFLIGIHKSYAFKRDFPFCEDLVVVDLDTDNVEMATLGSGSTSVALPFGIHANLVDKLDKILKPFVSGSDDLAVVGGGTMTREEQERNVRLAFRETVVQLLRGTHACSFRVKHLGEMFTFFDEREWIERRDVEDAPFLSGMARTQAFSMWLGGC